MASSSDEISEFIETTLKGISKGSGTNFILTAPVEFELLLIKKQDTNGKVDVKLAELGTKINEEAVQKIKFELGEIPKNKEDTKNRVLASRLP